MNKTSLIGYYLVASTVNFVIANKMGGYVDKYVDNLEKRRFGDSVVIAMFTPITMPFLTFKTGFYNFCDFIDKLNKP